jgi:S1-C subfamily serine protease
MILSDMKTQGFRRRPRVLLAAASAAAAALFAGSAVSSSTAAARATASIPGVVDINTNLRYESAAAAGTGIVLTSSGEVLTNNHVIRGATTIRVTDTSSGPPTSRCSGSRAHRT